MATVDHDDLVATIKQLLNDRSPDELRTTQHGDPHQPAPICRLQPITTRRAAQAIGQHPAPITHRLETRQPVRPCYETGTTPKVTGISTCSARALRLDQQYLARSTENATRATRDRKSVV